MTMEEKVIKKMEDSIKKIMDEGLNTNNLDTLYKLTKIKHMTKEDEKMNYGMREDYNGRRPGYDSYGNYGEGNYGRYMDNYGRRGYDRRYRGHDHIDRMADYYGRYEEGKQEYNRGNYGAKDDSLKSLEFMLKSAEDFFKMLKEEADGQEEINMIRATAQKISQM